MVTLHTNHEYIVIKTVADKAPLTVENSLNYCRSVFYDNTIFYRVINDFMIHGGGFIPGIEQKVTQAPVKKEANNGLKNNRGTLAMARTNDPHFATSQIFINVVDNNFLNFRSERSERLGILFFRRSDRGAGRGRENQRRLHRPQRHASERLEMKMLLSPM